MSIDWTRPIETDDGRPARLIVVNLGGASAQVSTVGHPLKDKAKAARMYHNAANQSFTYNYYTENGAWGGDMERKAKYGIRNVDDSASFIPEDWS